MKFLVDCDGVIFMSHVLWAKKYQKEVGDDKFKSLDNIVDWKFLIELLGEEFLDAYFTPEIVRDAPLDSVMACAIERIMDKHTVQFVTDVPEGRCRKVRRDRLMGLFSVYEHQISFVGKERIGMDADVLIDDRLEACLSFAKKRGKQSIIISRPWNVYPCKNKLPKGVYRAWGAHDMQWIVEMMK